MGPRHRWTVQRLCIMVCWGGLSPFSALLTAKREYMRCMGAYNHIRPLPGSLTKIRKGSDRPTNTSAYTTRRSPATVYGRRTIGRPVPCVRLPIASLIASSVHRYRTRAPTSTVPPSRCLGFPIPQTCASTVIAHAYRTAYCNCAGVNNLATPCHSPLFVEGWGRGGVEGCRWALLSRGADVRATTRARSSPHYFLRRVIGGRLGWPS